MKQSIQDQLTEIYVLMDDYLKAHPQRAQWRRSPNDEPRFTDAEVLTIGLMQGYFGCATLKQTYLLVQANAHSAFPHLCSYKQWLARLHALTALVGQLVEAARPTEGDELSLYLMDSKPIAVCTAQRHGRVRLLREDGAYFGKSSKGWYFGFKLQAIVDSLGHILGGVLTPANWNDRDAAPVLAWAVDGGISLADLGYRSRPLATLLAEDSDLLLLTRADAPEHRHLLSTVRQRVETSFSQLWSQFVDRVYSRSWNGLWNAIKLKLLYFNLCHARFLSAA